MITRSELAAPGVWVLLPDCRDIGDRLARGTGRSSCNGPSRRRGRATRLNAVNSLTATGQPGSASNNHRPTPGIPGPASRWNAGGRCPLLRHEPIGGASLGGDRAGRCGVTRVRLRRLIAAIRSAQLGNTVAVVEKKYWGGVCWSVGCVPSKALLRNAELAHLVNGEAKPLASTSMAPSVSTIRFDHVAAFRRSRKVADGRVRGVHFLMKKNDITELTGHGTFLDPRTLRVDLTGGGTETVTFANAIVAAGATIRLGPGHRVVAGADLGPAMGPGCE